MIYIHIWLKMQCLMLFSFTRKVTFLLYAFQCYQIDVINMYHFHNRTRIITRKEQVEPEKNIPQSVR